MFFVLWCLCISPVISAASCFGFARTVSESESCSYEVVLKLTINVQFSTLNSNSRPMPLVSCVYDFSFLQVIFPTVRNYEPNTTFVKSRFRNIVEAVAI